MTKPVEGDRALVNGEPCVRAKMKGSFSSRVCDDCPHDGKGTCDRSCGWALVWVREITYITRLLEGDGASL